MVWLKLTSKALYLMEGETASDKVDLQLRPNPTERSLKLPLSWFTRSDVPNGMVVALASAIEPTVVPKPIVKPSGGKGLQIQAPFGTVFDLIDAAKSSDPRLKQFHPMEQLSQGMRLPKYYIQVDRAKAFDQPLTKSFVLREFISDTEMRKGIQFPYFIPTAIVRTAQALENLRTKLGGQPLRISSGYRSPFYPDYLKFPGYTSAHRFGTAVDITAVGSQSASIAMMKRVDIAAFEGAVVPGNRPSGRSGFGFEYTESLPEMNNIPDHSHLDMGYISGEAELKHLGTMLITPQGK